MEDDRPVYLDEDSSSLFVLLVLPAGFCSYHLSFHCLVLCD